jgi:hypothetical protein
MRSHREQVGDGFPSKGIKERGSIEAVNQSHSLSEYLAPFNLHAVLVIGVNRFTFTGSFLDYLYTIHPASVLPGYTQHTRYIPVYVLNPRTTTVATSCVRSLCNKRCGPWNHARVAQRELTA